MLINTHFIISKSVLENLECRKAFFISEKNFIYGNIKPDISSKYVLEKHYLEESLSMVLEKIKNLCELTLDSLKKYFSISKLSQELGVICHFLCDFFCEPHSERWRFTHSIDTMNKHVAYEKGLNSFAKKMDFKNCNLGHKVQDNIEEFFHDLYDKYKSKDTSFEKDLTFSSHACNEVVNHVIDSILINTANSYNLQNCV
ncbi:MAG: zinc dependent phospholipase C family protein [Terrisporobacter sp.]|uniref:zinc dependent phospholipase C family protein n=1 Tax=Clostridia TaxID=186801 RepID=UPI002FC5DE12